MKVADMAFMDHRLQDKPHERAAFFEEQCYRFAEKVHYLEDIIKKQREEIKQLKMKARQKNA